MIGFFIEQLQKGEFFIYRNEKYLLEGLIKKTIFVRTWLLEGSILSNL
jgi:hypothetical protein